MELKLENISKTYHKFVNNQVLTAEKLNSFITYFDEQHRLSRVFISGIGIVCGFKLSFESDKVIITQGVGVTSDGDLIQLKTDNIEEKTDNIKETSNVLVSDKIDFTHYKQFLDLNANYSFFEAGNGDGKIEMWELFAKEVDNSFLLEDVSPQNNYGGLSSLTDKVVLLYLEAYSDKGDLCTAIDCDNQGEEQVSKLRVLLISEDVAENIVKKDPVFTWHNIAEKYTSLPEIKPLRVKLNDAIDLASIKNKFFVAIDIGIIKKLIKGFETIYYEVFEIETDNFIDEINQKLVFTKDNFDELPDFQYRYDLLSDMIDTFNEIKKLMLHINSECSPDVSSFPKHLLLGKLDEANIYKTFRHRIYRSPMSKNECFNRKKIESLIGRAERLVKSYDYQKELHQGIRITPSINGDTILGNRAIPYYYKIENDFLNFWSYERTANLKHAYNLSYHIEKLANEKEIKQPLLFNSDYSNFLRIEGHLDLNANECLAKINSDIRTYGLDFDCILLNLNKKEQSFTEFAQKHPSLLHKAGVPKGGTFVLVSENEIIIADFCLSYKIAQEEQKKGCAYYFIWPFKYFQAQKRELRLKQ